MFASWSPHPNWIPRKPKLMLNSSGGVRRGLCVAVMCAEDWSSGKTSEVVKMRSRPAAEKSALAGPPGWVVGYSTHDPSAHWGCHCSRRLRRVGARAALARVGAWRNVLRGVRSFFLRQRWRRRRRPEGTHGEARLHQRRKSTQHAQPRGAVHLVDYDRGVTELSRVRRDGLLQGRARVRHE